MRITVEQMDEFAHDLEGRVNYMYLDAAEPLGLVTTGLGNLLRRVEDALCLPWMHASDGRPATADEVAAVWRKVQRMQSQKRMDLPLRSDPSLILDDEAVRELVLQRLVINHEILRRRWPSIDFWPLDAELFAHSWAWAVGPNAAYPRMSKCLRENDFLGAAAECTINPQIGTIPERNRRNRLLLKNAAIVDRSGNKYSFDEFYYPRDLSAATPEPSSVAAADGS